MSLSFGECLFVMWGPPGTLQLRGLVKPVSRRSEHRPKSHLTLLHQGFGLFPGGLGMCPGGLGMCPRGLSMCHRGLGMCPRGLGMCPGGLGMFPEGLIGRTVKAMNLGTQPSSTNSYPRDRPIDESKTQHL